MQIVNAETDHPRSRNDDSRANDISLWHERVTTWARGVSEESEVLGDSGTVLFREASDIHRRDEATVETPGQGRSLEGKRRTAVRGHICMQRDRQRPPWAIGSRMTLVIPQPRLPKQQLNPTNPGRRCVDHDTRDQAFSNGQILDDDRSSDLRVRGR